MVIIPVKYRKSLLITLSLVLEGLSHAGIYPEGTTGARIIATAAFLFALLWPPPRREWKNAKRVAEGLKPRPDLEPLVPEKTCLPPSSK